MPTPTPIPSSVIAASGRGAATVRKQVEAQMQARWQPGPQLITALVGLLCLLWGSTWVVIRQGLEDLPPLFSAAIRFSISALLMAVVARSLSRREGGGRSPLWLSLTMGGMTFALSYAVVYRVEQTLPSALTSVLWGVYPMIAAVICHLYLPGERLTRASGLGFLIGFVGVLFLFLTDVVNVGANAVPAALLLLVSPLAVAIATAVVKRHGEGVSSLKLNRDAMGIGAILLWVAYLVFERDAEATWSGSAVFSILYLSIAGTVVTFGIFFWLLRFAPAFKLAVIPYVTPAVALLLGYFVAGEPIGLTTLVGMGLILLGVLTVTRA